MQKNDTKKAFVRNISYVGLFSELRLVDYNIKDDDIVECILYCNDINDVLVLNELDTTSYSVKVEYLIREVDITSLELMTQSEYIGFTADSNAIPLITQEESEEESQLQLESQPQMDDWLIGL